MPFVMILIFLFYVFQVQTYVQLFLMNTLTTRLPTRSLVASAGPGGLMVLGRGRPQQTIS